MFNFVPLTVLVTNRLDSHEFLLRLGDTNVGVGAAMTSYFLTRLVVAANVPLVVLLFLSAT